MKKALTGLLGSKTFWIAILGSAIAAGADQLGLDPSTVYSILGMFGLKIGQQAVADNGKEKALTEAKAKIIAATQDRSPAERAEALAELK